jgi:DNA polymerase III beta subunit, central domain
MHSRIETEKRTRRKKSMSTRKAKERKPAVSPIEAKAEALRKKFTAAQFTALLKAFPDPAAIEGKASPVKGDVEQLLRTLPQAERGEATVLTAYTRLRTLGVAAVDDYRITQSKTAEAALRRALDHEQGALCMARNEVASIRARLKELQGSLVPPAMKALPGPAVIQAKAPIIENPKDVTYLNVRRSVLEALVMVAAKDDVRHYLEGVHLHADKREVRAVATNGHTLLLHSTQSAEDVPPWLQGDGLIIPREGLALALATFAKIKDDEGEVHPLLQVGYASGHAFVTLREISQTATFRLRAIDGKFPDYRKVIESAGRVLAGGERLALSGVSLNGDYLKQAAAIGGKFDAKSITPFVGDADDTPVVISFQGEPGALFIVMPMKADAETQMPVQTLALIGKGLEGTLAALKAVQTRQKNALSEAKSEAEKKPIEASMREREQRIAAVQLAIKGRLLEGPKAA